VVDGEGHVAAVGDAAADDVGVADRAVVDVDVSVADIAVEEVGSTADDGVGEVVVDDGEADVFEEAEAGCLHQPGLMVAGRG